MGPNLFLHLSKKIKISSCWISSLNMKTALLVWAWKMETGWMVLRVESERNTTLFTWLRMLAVIKRGLWVSGILLVVATAALRAMEFFFNWLWCQWSLFPSCRELCFTLQDAALLCLGQHSSVLGGPLDPSSFDVAPLPCEPRWDWVRHCQCWAMVPFTLLLGMCQISDWQHLGIPHFTLSSLIEFLLCQSFSIGIHRGWLLSYWYIWLCKGLICCSLFNCPYCWKCLSRWFDEMAVFR